MDLGPLFVFTAVLISHLIPFLPVPGYLATISYVASRNDPVSLALAALATALGAALGKLVVFLYGYGVGRAVMGEELAYAKKFFDKVSKWGVDVAVFIFAASPLADDVLYIPLGAAGYDIRRFFLSLLAGKLVLATAIVIFADATLAVLDQVFGNSWISSAVLAAITIALTVLVLRIKWSKVLAAYETGGVREAVRAALRSIMGK
jgi:membrane protein DedA with SNARE-associated domain